ncbi:hypothetical protein ACH5RR_032359 [Cinchona calisaya]|uniref:Uncharacterized protein n=1 Tax=Cinchona calisaya TaxID=153742 RepID=A0ABD2YKY7_9GENT
MEGLIPMLYKTIKKTITRRHYEYLGSAAATTQSYNIADFYVNDDHHTMRNRQYADQQKKIDGFNINAENSKGDYRRYNSFHVKFSPDNTVAQSKKLVRFRSHRLFSCVTG